MWCGRCRVPSATIGSPTPTCSADRAAPARHPRHAFWPRRSTAPPRSMVSPAVSARRAPRSPRAPPSTSTSSTPPPTTGSMPCATWWHTRPWARPGAGRSTSSTRSTCCPTRPPTRCSRRWRSRRATWSSCWPPPTPRRFRRPSAAGPSTSNSASSGRRRSAISSCRYESRPGSPSTTSPSRRRCGAAGDRPVTPSPPWIRWRHREHPTPPDRSCPLSCRPSARER
jgi:hypothetical protein